MPSAPAVGRDELSEALVAILSAVQDRYGYLPERALRRISDRMSIHWAQVFGAAGLGGFRLLPASGHVAELATPLTTLTTQLVAGPDRVR